MKVRNLLNQNLLITVCCELIVLSENVIAVAGKTEIPSQNTSGLSKM